MIATPLHPIKGPWPGKLAIAARPRGGDWLADELHAWHEAGHAIVASALTSEEIRELDLVQEPDACRAEGLDFVSLPIPDRGTPESRATTETELRTWERALAQGRSMVIHCRQGIGRSALLAASLLVLAGVPPTEAWRRVRDARRAKVPDTTEQELWVNALADQKTTISG